MSKKKAKTSRSMNVVFQENDQQSDRCMITLMEILSTVLGAEDLDFCDKILPNDSSAD